MRAQRGRPARRGRRAPGLAVRGRPTPAAGKRLEKGWKSAGKGLGELPERGVEPGVPPGRGAGEGDGVVLAARPARKDAVPRAGIAGLALGPQGRHGQRAGETRRLPCPAPRSLLGPSPGTAVTNNRWFG